MSILHDRIRAVVEERLRIARAVAGYRQRPGELIWAQCDPERDHGLIGDALGNVVTYDVGNREQAEFIAANDPADAILGAEHALAVLERHAPVLDELDRLVCDGCEELCHSRSGLGCDSPDAPYPCAEVRSLATRWRVEVDG